MSTVEWLDSLNVGDQVVVERGYVYASLKLERVTHTTATQIHVGPYKFRRADGRRMGEQAYDRVAISQPTPDRLRKIRRDAAVEALAHVVWEGFNDDDLFAAEAIVVKARKRRELARTTGLVGGPESTGRSEAVAGAAAADPVVGPDEASSATS
jgi:hypothetical protein